MNKGRIIFLNGLTSCGKTSVAEQMKTLCGDVLYVVSNDIFHGMVDWKFFTADYWKMVAHTITAQYYAAHGMAEAGFSVVIDGMLLDLPEYREQFGKSNAELVREIFAGLDVTFVDFRCPPEELRRRNLARGNRGEFQSDEQARLMTKEFEYDLTIDVMKTMPDESAVKILEFCGLPWAYTKKINCSVAASRRKMLSSLFGSRGKITVLTDEKHSVDGYPVELSVSPADPGDDIAAELIRREYIESARSDRVITLVRGRRERVRILLQSDGDLLYTLSQLGRTVTVTVDRPAGSVHPDHPDMVYPVNYGYVSGISSGDDEWMDAYILGVCEPLSEFTGTVSAVIHRFDDCDDKLIVTPAGASFSSAEIAETVNFCEKYFDSAVICPAD
ncbi:MAG: AAA family ATPase [Clostridia bacterium]|nr:AAA family ATPase [Clostridia bacterium]